MSKKSCKPCCDNPVLALCLIRMGVGIFFLVFGLMKLCVMGPDAVTMMITKLFGIEGMFAVLTAWAVIAIELLGGVFVILGKMVPKCVYKLTLLGMIIVNVVGFISAHWIMNSDGFDQKQFLWHLLLLFVLLGLMVVSPKSPCGICGDKSCDTGKCDV